MLRSLFGVQHKQHKYDKQAQLQNLTAEQIVNLNPIEVSSTIDKETSGVQLPEQKRRAMYTLLAIKTAHKQRPDEKARQSAINRFLVTEGIRSNPELDSLISNATQELVEENNKKLMDQIEMKSIENRLRILRGESPIPYTEEEDTFCKLHKGKLHKGGKRKTRKSFRKNISKRNRREKTKKGRKGSKVPVKTQRRNLHRF